MEAPPTPRGYQTAGQDRRTRMRLPSQMMYPPDPNPTCPRALSSTSPASPCVPCLKEWYHHLPTGLRRNPRASWIPLEGSIWHRGQSGQCGRCSASQKRLSGVAALGGGEVVAGLQGGAVSLGQLDRRKGSGCWWVQGWDKRTPSSGEGFPGLRGQRFWSSH